MMNAFDILMTVIFLFIQNWSITSTDQHLAFFPPALCLGEFSVSLPTDMYPHLFLMVVLRFDIFIHVVPAGLGLVAVRASPQVWCSGSSSLQGCSCCRPRALRLAAPAVMAHRLSRCSFWALKHRLKSCGALA